MYVRHTIPHDQDKDVGLPLQFPKQKTFSGLRADGRKIRPSL